MESPVPSILTTLAVKMSELSLPTDGSLSDNPPLASCLSSKPGGKYSLHSWRLANLHPFTCFVFQVECFWTYPKPFHHFFSCCLSCHIICPVFVGLFLYFFRKSKGRGKNQMCFFWDRLNRYIAY